MGLDTYIGTEEQRKKLAFIGAGFAAVVVASWTAFVHFSEKPQMNEPEAALTVETSFTICHDECEPNLKRCPNGTVRIDRSTKVEEYIGQRCSKLLDFKKSGFSQGLTCGTNFYNVKCTASKK